MSRPWFKFFTRDFRDGVRRLTLEQVGAYTLVLSLMYDSPGGRLVDDEEAIMAHTGMSRRVWRRLRAELLSHGKIAIDAGCIVNSRVLKEQSLAEVSAKFRRSFGQVGGINSGKSRREAKENKQLAEASASILLQPDTRDTEGRDTKTDKSVLDSAQNARSETKASRKRQKVVSTELSMPTQPLLAMIEHAAENGFVGDELRSQFAKWRDYHIANATQIADQAASWRTWIGNAVEFRRRDRARNVQAIGRASDRPAIYPNPYRG